MKKIVRGNDFVMVIPVRKIVDGEKIKFPLPACTDIEVNLVSAYRRYGLSYSIGVSEDSQIEARVEGDKIPVGIYALEVKGKIFGNDWRSNEYEQVQIVDNNASGNADMSVSEGEDSVIMDTAIIILPPTAYTEDIIKSCKEATEECEKATEQIIAGENVREEAEETRKDNENVRVSNETARNVAEDARVIAENERKTEENKRKTDEHERSVAEETRKDSEEKRMSAEINRYDAEKIRESSEKARNTNETSRAEAEKLREAAEKKRKEDTAIAIAHAESVDVAIDGSELVVSIDE